MRILALIYLALMAVAGAQDPGKEVIGKVRTEVLFGTNGSSRHLKQKSPEYLVKFRILSLSAGTAFFTLRTCF